jgi:hypothetical protein
MAPRQRPNVPASDASASDARRAACCTAPAASSVCVFYGWCGSYSMQIRPCLSSASRSHLMSMKSERYSGSKPVAAPGRPLDWQDAAVRNGMAFIGLETAMVAPAVREACADRQRFSNGKSAAGYVQAPEKKERELQPAPALCAAHLWLPQVGSAADVAHPAASFSSCSMSGSHLAGKCRPWRPNSRTAALDAESERQDSARSQRLPLPMMRLAA